MQYEWSVSIKYYKRVIYPMKWVVFVILLFAILLLGCTPGDDVPIDDVNITVNCLNTSDGYECTYDIPDDSNITRLQLDKQDEKMKEQCEADGGEYKCYGFCTEAYERICDFPYEDAGKSCIDNSECTGYCIADDWECETNCTGKCAQYRLNMCDNPTHLTEGVAHYESILCD